MSWDWEGTKVFEEWKKTQHNWISKYEYTRVEIKVFCTIDNELCKQKFDDKDGRNCRICEKSRFFVNHDEK